MTDQEQQHPAGTRARIRWLVAVGDWAKRHALFVRILQLLFLVTIAVVSAVLLFVPEIRDSSLGYGGIFLINVLSSSVVFFPAPGILITCSVSTTSIVAGDSNIGLWWIVLIASVGNTIGESVSYGIGYIGGTDGLRKKRFYIRLRLWMRRYGGITVFSLSFLPLPLFDLAGIMAGALRMNYLRFNLWVAAGKLAKFSIVVWGCYYGLGWIMTLFGA